MNVQDQIAYIIDEFEGGNAEKRQPYASYSDDEDDHGNATRFGITRAILSAHLGLAPDQLCPKDRVHELSRDEAIVIGTEAFALKPGLYRIADERLRFVTIDYAFNSGPPQAVKDLQRVLGMAEVTGNFGPHTEFEVNRAGDIDLRCELLSARRLALIGSIVEKHRDQARWIHGWLVRIGAVLTWRPHVVA